MWRGAVSAAIKGKRGQAFIVEAICALDAMPSKRLITDSLQDPARGEFCTLGVVGASRGMDMVALKNVDPEEIGKAFGISKAMSAEIMFINDDYGESEGNNREKQERRWSRMRCWLESNLLEPKTR